MSDWQIRKDYLLLTEDEEAALKSLQPMMARHVDELVDAFYRHLLQFPETRRLLSDELIATRLKDAQKRYLISLVTGPYDERYRDDRIRIGQVHDRIGLTPQWYLGAYALYLNLLHPLIFREYRTRLTQCQFLRIALTKVVFLDIQLAIEAYIQKGSEKLEFANRQLAELSRELGKGLTQKEKALQKERDFIGSVLETSGALVIVLDADGRIVLFNRACESTSGYSSEEVKNRYVWDILLLPEEVEPVQAVFREVRGGRLLNNYQNHWVTKSGERRLIAWNATHTIDSKGAIEYVIGIGIDITDLKRTQEQLRRTERLAELGTLASGMAHEIGTPMNVILGRAEYLMRRTADETVKKGLETIVTQVERITRIMNQLLTFARRRPSERGPLDVIRTIEETLEVLQERLRKHRIKVETDLAREMPAVYADQDQMSQVLLNLVINAIHAMPDGGTLRLGVTQADGNAVLTVADTGCGIPKQDLPKIFDPFFTTKEIGKGTGLGLTVVHGIIQEHGGAITVESEPDLGTTFRITLPLYQSS
jgi:PAS domain S-box-containing protein